MRAATFLQLKKKNQEVLTTSGTYPWSVVTQIFHSGQQSNGGDRKTST